MPGDFGALIGLIGMLAGVGVLAGALAGAYFFGKSRAQRESFTTGQGPELMARFNRVEQIVESTAIEIERISEGQRFTTKTALGRENRRIVAGRLH
jgi:hypothetical protein